MSSHFCAPTRRAGDVGSPGWAYRVHNRRWARTRRPRRRFGNCARTPNLARHSNLARNIDVGLVYDCARNGVKCTSAVLECTRGHRVGAQVARKSSRLRRPRILLRKIRVAARAGPKCDLGCESGWLATQWPTGATPSTRVTLARSANGWAFVKSCMHAACANWVVIGACAARGHPTRDVRAERAGRARARDVGSAERAVVRHHGSAGPRWCTTGVLAGCGAPCAAPSWARGPAAARRVGRATSACSGRCGTRRMDMPRHARRAGARQKCRRAAHQTPTQGAP